MSPASEGIRIHSRLSIPWSEVEVGAARSGGPGGQNVNKVATKVLLRFRPAESGVLGPERGARVAARLAARLTKDGSLIIQAGRHRERQRNLEEAAERLAVLLREALTTPRKRVSTRPTAGSKRRRRKAKERQSERKRDRKRIDP